MNLADDLSAEEDVLKMMLAANDLEVVAATDDKVHAIVDAIESIEPEPLDVDAPSPSHIESSIQNLLAGLKAIKKRKTIVPCGSSASALPLSTPIAPPQLLPPTTGASPSHASSALPSVTPLASPPLPPTAGDQPLEAQGSSASASTPPFPLEPPPLPPPAEEPPDSSAFTVPAPKSPLPQPSQSGYATPPLAAPDSKAPDSDTKIALAEDAVEQVIVDIEQATELVDKKKVEEKAMNKKETLALIKDLRKNNTGNELDYFLSLLPHYEYRLWGEHMWYAGRSSVMKHRRELKDSKTRAGTKHMNMNRGMGTYYMPFLKDHFRRMVDPSVLAKCGLVVAKFPHGTNLDAQQFKNENTSNYYRLFIAQAAEMAWSEEHYHYALPSRLAALLNDETKDTVLKTIVAVWSSVRVCETLPNHEVPYNDVPCVLAKVAWRLKQIVREFFVDLEANQGRLTEEMMEALVADFSIVSNTKWPLENLANECADMMRDNKNDNSCKDRSYFALRNASCLNPAKSKMEDMQHNKVMNQVRLDVHDHAMELPVRMKDVTSAIFGGRFSDYAMKGMSQGDLDAAFDDPDLPKTSYEQPRREIVCTNLVYHAFQGNDLAKATPMALKEITNAWMSQLLGGEGELYKQVCSGQCWISLGAVKEGCLMYGPLWQGILKYNGAAVEYFSLKKSIEAASVVCFHNFSLFDPKAKVGCANEAWCGVAVRLESECGLPDEGGVLLRTEKDETLVRFALSRPVSLTEEALSDICRLVHCKAIPNKSRKRGLTLALLLHYFPEHREDPNIFSAMADKFLAATCNDLVSDENVVRKALSFLDESEIKDHFKKVQKDVDKRTIDRIADSYIKDAESTGNTFNTRTNPKGKHRHKTVESIKKFAPPGGHLRVDYNKPAICSEYPGRPKGQTSSSSKWPTTLNKYGVNALRSQIKFLNMCAYECGHITAEERDTLPTYAEMLVAIHEAGLDLDVETVPEGHHLYLKPKWVL